MKPELQSQEYKKAMEELKSNTDAALPVLLLCGKGSETDESLWHENRKSYHEVCKGHYGRKMIVSSRSKITTAEGWQMM